MAKENPTWGYDRIVGALANLGQRLSDQTVGNILRRTESLLPSNENTPPAGETSSALIWMFWWERISSQWKCLRSKGWLPTTCCSLSSWRVGGFVWPESRPYGQESQTL